MKKFMIAVVMLPLLALITLSYKLFDALGLIKERESDTPENVFSKDAFYDYLSNFHATQVIGVYLNEFIELEDNALAKHGFTYEGFVEHLLSQRLDGRLYELADGDKPFNHSCVFLEKRDDGKYTLFVLERGHPRGIGVFETREAAIRYEARAKWNSLEKHIQNYLDKK